MAASAKRRHSPPTVTEGASTSNQMKSLCPKAASERDQIQAPAPWGPGDAEREGASTTQRADGEPLFPAIAANRPPACRCRSDPPGSSASARRERRATDDDRGGIHAPRCGLSARPLGMIRCHAAAPRLGGFRVGAIGARGTYPGRVLCRAQRLPAGALSCVLRGMARLGSHTTAKSHRRDVDRHGLHALQVEPVLMQTDN
uniref:Uncharacterized protein n=1 Tax=Setaria viridis TaxID=4556 RepID=A0A4U6VWE5_SETVI|nr:hypothetical protein SEVIR_2G293800v2 [Setaria viridis]